MSNLTPTTSSLLTPEAIAMCDTLTVKALEAVGKRIVRAAGERHNQLKPRPYWEAHRLWECPKTEARKALRGAFDAVGALLPMYRRTDEYERTDYLNIEDVETMLYAYTLNLVEEQRPHSRSNMLRFFDAVLSAPFPGLVYTVNGEPHPLEVSQ